jgi:DNA-binding transcriptional ArsR family regulator
MVEEKQNSPLGQDAQLNRTFGALSDPSRRQIIALLREAGDLKVTDIAQAFSMSLNGVSKHIKVLEQAGLIIRHIEGREHRLRVDWTGLQGAYEWLHFYRHFWGARLDALVDHVQQPHKKEGTES